MIDLGKVTVRTTVVRETSFVCPYCGLDRSGAEVEPQRWLTAFGLPLVPLATLEHQIRCAECNHLCDLAVLDIPTTAQLDQYLRDATLASAVAVLRAAGTSHPRVRARAVEVVRAVSPSFTESDLLEALTGHVVDHTTATRKLASEMSAHGKQAFLSRFADLAELSGLLSFDTRRVLIDLGIALDMSAAHINGVLAVADLGRAA